jgi:hypothetical protein
MTPLQELSHKQKFLKNRGCNCEITNEIYLKIINEKFGFIKKEFCDFDKAKEVTKKFNTKTGTYET